MVDFLYLLPKQRGRHFLVFTLRNLRLASGKQTFTGAKVHLADTSFSVEALRMSGTAISENPSLFGHVLESFVVNQIVPKGESRTSGLNGLETTLLPLKQSFSVSEQQAEYYKLIHAIGALSPKLKPLASALEGAFNLFSDMSTMIDELILAVRSDAA